MASAEAKSDLAGVLTAPSEALSFREQRRRAARLAVRGSERDLPMLIEGLRSPNRKVRAGSAAALGKIGTALAIDALVENLRVSADPSVVMASARRLARLGEACAVPAIEAALVERGDQFDRHGAKRALVVTLGGFAQRSSVPALSEQLADSDGLTRKRAARALGRINDPESRRALEIARSELWWWRGRWARRTLARMCRDLAR